MSKQFKKYSSLKEFNNQKIRVSIWGEQVPNVLKLKERHPDLALSTIVNIILANIPTDVLDGVLEDYTSKKAGSKKSNSNKSQK